MNIEHRTINNMKLKKGDKIKIVTGKDKGKEGTVERVFPADGRVLVPGLNMFKRHMKPRGEGKPGGIVDVARPLVVAKVALVCSKCKKITRVGYKIIGDKKVRVCRKCEEEI